MNQPQLDLQQLPPFEEENPPAFNIPGAILILGLLLVVVHAVRIYGLDDNADQLVLTLFSFWPISYQIPVSELYLPLSRYWSPVTYALLHSDWTHLLMNMLWLVAFGSAIARRFGVFRFFAFVVVSSAASALAHYLFHVGSNVPVVGASGAVSAFMGAAMRFAFAPGATSSPDVRSPAYSIIGSLSNRAGLTFAMFWLAFNFLFGSGLIPILGDYDIAWEAHMGGFLFGWLAFGIFDRNWWRST